MLATHHVHAMFIFSVTLTKPWLPHDAHARVLPHTGFHTDAAGIPWVPVGCMGVDIHEWVHGKISRDTLTDTVHSSFYHANLGGGG